MASSRGRERLRERLASGQCFVFGSSTPRDLSHMHMIPAKLRGYDVRIKHPREGPALREYMEKARSLTRAETSEDGRHWAFGSSTPRDLSHLTKIPSKQRAYDARAPKKSNTSPQFTSPAHKTRSTTAPPPQRHITRPAKLDDEDDISSEPDFVQDRIEFMQKAKQEMKESTKVEVDPTPVEPKKKANGDIKEVKKKVDDPKPKETPSSPSIGSPIAVAESKKVEAKFSHAAELADEVKRTERVPANLHEEENATAVQDRVHGWEDQIVVSELNEVTPAKEIVVSKEGIQKTGNEGTPIASEVLKKVEHLANSPQKTQTPEKPPSNSPTKPQSPVKIPPAVKPILESPLDSKKITETLQEQKLDAKSPVTATSIEHIAPTKVDAI